MNTETTTTESSSRRLVREGPFGVAGELLFDASGVLLPRVYVRGVGYLDIEGRLAHLDNAEAAACYDHWWIASADFGGTEAARVTRVLNAWNKAQEQALVPRVGMGATIRNYSDRQACTIVEVSRSGKRIVVQHDEATLLNGFESGEPDALTFTLGGFCGHVEGVQRYSYAPNPAGSRETFTLRKTGQWIAEGEKAKGGTQLIVGRRAHHHDYNF